MPRPLPFPTLVAATLAVLIAAPDSLQAAPARDLPVEVVQPDGTRVALRATGDERAWRLHDDAGFTVVRDDVTGWFVYGQPGGDRLEPTAIPAGAGDPLAGGLVPGLRDREAEARALEAAWASGPRPRWSVRSAPQRGRIENLVIFVRFADEEDFFQELWEYEDAFNSADTGTSSLLNYFREVSGGLLEVRSRFFPVSTDGWVASYQDPHPRAYFRRYHGQANPTGYLDDWQRADREFAMLKNALAFVRDMLPADLDLDGDDDGLADNVILMVSGFPDGWSDLLWPHMWQLSDDVYLGDVRIADFNLQFQGLLGFHGILAHEMSHTLGAPDLYHYNQDDLAPVGAWDLMEGNMPVPQHMGAYLKHKYLGWLDGIPQAAAGGRYTLNPATGPQPTALRIPLPPSQTQYLQVEYRRARGPFESSLPGSGLLVFRIDPDVGEGNAGGPPDEVYLYRPGGDGRTKRGDLDAAPLRAGGRTAFTEATSPAPFLQDGTPGFARIFDVGPAGDTISFRVCLAAPDCAGRCGDDGCGGDCGGCGAGEACSAGRCVPASSCQAGWACVDACEAGADGCPGPCGQALDAATEAAVNRAWGCVKARDCRGPDGDLLPGCLDRWCGDAAAACTGRATIAGCRDLLACRAACPAADDPLTAFDEAGRCRTGCAADGTADARRLLAAVDGCAVRACPVCLRADPTAADHDACTVCRADAAAGPCAADVAACQAHAGGCGASCANRNCGDDGCGGSCGGCNAGWSCRIDGRCAEGACTCDGRECGGDGCGVPCGTCPAGQACDAAGKCVEVPAPCEARDAPGCDGCACEACACERDPYCCTVAWDAACRLACAACGGAACLDGCVARCRPDGCGDDGCGGDCGGCDDGNPCTVDSCVHGGCEHVPAPGSTSCDDGDPCTTGDRCGGEGGACAGTAGACDDPGGTPDPSATDLASPDAGFDGGTDAALPDPGPRDVPPADLATGDAVPDAPADATAGPDAASGDDSGGCAAGSSPAPGALPCLAALLLVAAGLRRRPSPPGAR